jgi:hypothetical protein
VDCGRVGTPGTIRYRPKRGQRRDVRRADAPAEATVRHLEPPGSSGVVFTW